MKNERKHYTAAGKVAILRRHLVDIRLPIGQSAVSLRDSRTWAIRSSSALFLVLPNLLARSPSSFPAWPYSKSGPMLDSQNKRYRSRVVSVIQQQDEPKPQCESPAKAETWFPFRRN